MGWIDEIEETFGAVAKTLHILQKSDDLLQEVMPDSSTDEQTTDTTEKSSPVDSDESDE